MVQVPQNTVLLHHELAAKRLNHLEKKQIFLEIEERNEGFNGSSSLVVCVISAVTLRADMPTEILSLLTLFSVQAQASDFQSVE